MSGNAPYHGELVERLCAARDELWPSAFPFMAQLATEEGQETSVSQLCHHIDCMTGFARHATNPTYPFDAPEKSQMRLFIEGVLRHTRKLQSEISDPRGEVCGALKSIWQIIFDGMPDDSNYKKTIFKMVAQLLNGQSLRQKSPSGERPTYDPSDTAPYTKEEMRPETPLPQSVRPRSGGGGMNPHQLAALRAASENSHQY